MKHLLILVSALVVFGCNQEKSEPVVANAVVGNTLDAKDAEKEKAKIVQKLKNK